MVPLPIDAMVCDVTQRLRAARSLVLVAEPGAGKTTRVPPAILKAGLLSAEHPNIVLLQPRRVAARAAAQRIADENHWQIGREVGYQIRFERKISADTRLHVMTEGVLTRQLLDDPTLDGVGCVILDEFHERSLHTDVAIAMLREIRQTVRPDLLIVVMSATLDAERAAKFLEDCPIIRSAGRAFPVEIEHAASPTRFELADRIAEIVSSLNDPGDVLVFLPGVGEIQRAIEAIDRTVGRDVIAIPLHGSLSGKEQFAALCPANRRKIVVATNIAETSLTIDGVRTVIDSGLARIAMYDPRRGMDRLELKRISHASATQRAGRAGRTAPGRCIRLWSHMEDRSLDEFETPEIRRVDLTATVLALREWGHSNPRTFGWFEPPTEAAIESAERLLEMLGAIAGEHGGRITELGRRLLELPLHPRLARLMVAAVDQGLSREGASIAALLSEKDVFRAQSSAPPHMRHATTTSKSDLLLRLDAMNDRNAGVEIDAGAIRQARQARDELERIARRIEKHQFANGGAKPNPSGESDAYTRLLRLPLWAYPDRVCRRRTNDPSAAVMVGGGGVRLTPESTVHDADFFIALDPRQDQRNSVREAIVRIASAIDVEWLEEMFPQEIRSESSAVFDARRRRVVGRRATFYRDLLLREEMDTIVDADEAGRILADAARSVSVELFAADEGAGAIMARVALLREYMPEHAWPTFDEHELGDILAEAAIGKRSIDELSRGGLSALLMSRLSYPLDRLLEEHAPTEMEVPSGSRIRLRYAKGNPPTLAVRLQELFGWTTTPRVAGGRVSLRLLLLGPNFRPVQTTDDLNSFWSGAYFQVRKDLRVRYPRHAWPDDPMTAAPQAKGGRRS